MRSRAALRQDLSSRKEPNPRPAITRRMKPPADAAAGGALPLDVTRGCGVSGELADWLHPEGPDSNVGGRELHPVTHVAYSDAAAYAEWAGKSLPSEAEWEYGARGGLEGATYTWGDEFSPRGRMMANTWQGEFPWLNLGTDGYEGTSPVEKFPPNGYGLYDMAGNVWEWTVDDFEKPRRNGSPCCAPQDRDFADERFPPKVIKGGSHLCAPSYCLRYRPVARQAEAVDTTTCHIGFRCVIR
jgi:sulfatase modifying factor 1